MRLRLARVASQDQEPSGGPNSRRASENGSGKSRGGAEVTWAPEEKHDGSAAAVGSGGSSTGLLAGGPAAALASEEQGGPGPVLLKWEADKRLQKKVEVLQGKLKVGRSSAQKREVGSCWPTCPPAASRSPCAGTSLELSRSQGEKGASTPLAVLSTLQASNAGAPRQCVFDTCHSGKSETGCMIGSTTHCTEARRW